MPEYLIFGGVFRSDLTFPELAPASGAAPHPRWQLTTSDQPRPVRELVPMGREEVEPGVQVTLSRHAHGMHLAFDDTGLFEISNDGAVIDWFPPSAPDLAAARKDVLGRVLAICLHQQDVVALHGSAVQLGGEAVAFLAPKFHGKSTTAAALVDSGALLLADDIVAVSTGASPAVLPSVPVVQLWKDSAAHVGTGASSVAGDEAGAKLQRRWEASHRNANAAAPLSAVYLLAPMPGDAEVHVKRSRLSGVEAALSLLSQSKVGALLGVERRATLLQATSELADLVPVYRLEVPRDFGRLAELTDALWAWHGGVGGRADTP